MLIAYKEGNEHIFEEVTAIKFLSKGIMRGVDISILRHDNSSKVIMRDVSEGKVKDIKNAYLYGGYTTIQLDKFQ